MNTRTLLNLGLFVLLVGLGLLVFFEPGLEKPPAPVKISSFDPGQVTQIHVERADRDALQFEKQEGHWLIHQAKPMPANRFKVLTLLSLISAEAIRSYTATELDSGKLGLVTPAISVRFNNEPEIQFGTTESISGNRYVRRGDKIYLIKDRYQHLVEANFTEFVNNRLLPEDSTVETLQLPNKELDRTDTAHWSLAPEDDDVSADAIQKLIDTWKHTSALWIRRYEEQSTTESIQIKLKGQLETIRFEIISRQPELVLARPDWKIQYHLSDEFATKLFEFEEPSDEQQGNTE